MHTTMQADERADVGHSFRAMASQVTIRVVDPSTDPSAAIAEIERTFRDVERTCSRFDDSSDLMRANVRPEEWTEVSSTCLEVIRLAYEAYERTDGAFDPRVLRTLSAMGYDRSLNFAAGGVLTPDATLPAIWATEAWQPEFDDLRGRVRLGGHPIDLGGIGKGYAVRRGIAALDGVGRAALVEAGGDLATYGDGPGREPGDTRAWRAAVEDPRGGERAIAVLDVSDAAVATSSIRLRQWRAGERRVHHLIDPRTGTPAASGLLSVTVLGEDPAWAEVWTKAAFLRGAVGIADFTREQGLTALWVDDAGVLDATASMRDRILWEASDGH